MSWHSFVFLFCFFLPVSQEVFAEEGGLDIIVSVDWEGRELAPENLEAMQAFRKEFPEIPLLHFLNAAYYTKSDADAAAITKKIQSVLLPDDEHGLHIHVWKSLVTKAGVKFRSEPAFRGAIKPRDCDYDCGHDVAMSVYPESELSKIIGFSIKTLRKYGFQKPRSFRAGAWQAEERVFRALLQHGISIDSSAMDAEFLKERWGQNLLYSLVAKKWPEISSTSQPYRLKLGDKQEILQFPNNASLADYVKADKLLAVFRANAELWQRDRTKRIVVMSGFHQETAAKFLPQFREGLVLIQNYAKTEGIPLRFALPKPEEIFKVKE